MGLPKGIHEREVERERKKNMRCFTRFRNWRDDLLYNRSITRKIYLERDCSCSVG